MNDIQIAFFDLDGTLLNDQKEISKKNKEALEYLKSKNIVLVLATGRFDSYALKYADELKIIDYIISNNGSLIYDIKNRKYIYEKKINNNIIKDAWNYTINNEIGITMNTKGHRYSNQYATTNDNENTIISSLDELSNGVYQIVFTSFKRKKVTELLEYLRGLPIVISYISNIYYTKKRASMSVDVNLPKINKGTAALELLKLLNIDNKNSIAFGDSVNDLDLFDICNYKIAMENSKDELKEKATHITLSNNNEGVSHFIFKHIK